MHELPRRHPSPTPPSSCGLPSTGSGNEARRSCRRIMDPAGFLFFYALIVAGMRPLLLYFFFVLIKFRNLHSRLFRMFYRHQHALISQRSWCSSLAPVMAQRFASSYLTQDMFQARPLRIQDRCIPMHRQVPSHQLNQRAGGTELSTH